MEEEELVPMYPGSSRAILVEAYDGVMIDAHHPPGFERGLDGFSEKQSARSFCSCKIYWAQCGACMVGYIAESEGMTLMRTAQ